MTSAKGSSRELDQPAYLAPVRPAGSGASRDPARRRRSPSRGRGDGQWTPREQPSAAQARPRSRSRRSPGGWRSGDGGDRARGELADGRAGDRDDGNPEEHLVLGTKPITLRARGRLRDQHLVAGVVRGRALRGREVLERQADRPGRRREPQPDDLGRQLGGHPGGERDRDHPGLRQGRAGRAPEGDPGGREGRSVGRRSRRGRRQGLRYLRRLERSGCRDDVGELDGAGPARQGQRRLPGRPGRQPGRRGAAREHRQGLREAPRR